MGVKEKFQRTYRSFLNLPQQKTEEQALYDSIWEAKKEWELAEARFRQALGQEMVDYAIYDAMAARKKYMYLMTRAKELGM